MPYRTLSVAAVRDGRLHFEPISRFWGGSISTTISALDAAFGGLGTSTCEIHAEPFFISYFSSFVYLFQHPRSLLHFKISIPVFSFFFFFPPSGR